MSVAAQASVEVALANHSRRTSRSRSTSTGLAADVASTVLLNPPITRRLGELVAGTTSPDPRLMAAAPCFHALTPLESVKFLYFHVSIRRRLSAARAVISRSPSARSRAPARGS